MAPSAVPAAGPTPISAALAGERERAPAARPLLVVVARYGDRSADSLEVQVVERLAARHEVEVATTLEDRAAAKRARADVVDGVRVRGFPVEHARGEHLAHLERRMLDAARSLGDERAWIRARGPHSPDLLEFLHRHGTEYAAAIFSGLDAPTVFGLPLVPERSLLLAAASPTGAPGPRGRHAVGARPVDLASYRALFHLPRAIAYRTAEERDRAWGAYRNEHVPSEILDAALADELFDERLDRLVAHAAPTQ